MSFESNVKSLFPESLAAGCFVLQEAASVVIDCPDPDHMTSCERKVARVAHEEASFSQDHYL